MNLSRIGANRKENRSIAFSDRAPDIIFDAEKGILQFLVRKGDGMGVNGEYDYTIALDSRDLESIFEVLSSERTAFTQGTLQKTLQNSTHSLLRLLIASSNLPFQTLLSERQSKLIAAREKLAQQNTR